MENLTLSAEERTIKGKNASRRIRKQGLIPAVLYSHGQSTAIQVNRKELFNIFKGHISESIIFDLNFKDNAELNTKVFIKDYQQDPITDDIIHLDFYRVKMDEEIQTHVPVEIVGNAPGVKVGGILEVLEKELLVECLPAKLPEKIDVDVSALEIGNSIHIADLKLPEGVKVLDDADKVVVTIIAPHKVEEVAEETAEGETVEESQEASSET